jgi:hypothetical protein
MLGNEVDSAVVALDELRPPFSKGLSAALKQVDLVGGRS